MYNKGVKRILDFLAALIGLLLISPIFIVVMLWLWYCNRGSAFFTQERPGKNGKIFKVIKFKSMTDAKDLNGKLLPDEDRLTSAGEFVRKTSLDEIPQLINIIKGDMSFIGPRPLLPVYLDYYTIEETNRHKVRPGISGLAQVQGRNNLCWDVRLKLDTYYVRNLSFKLDCAIFFKTIKNVIQAKDVVIIPGQKFKPLHIERKDEIKKNK